MKTTLEKIRTHSPCAEGWEKLLKYLGKTKADDDQLSILTILDSNGLDDALWCLRAVEGHYREIRLYAIWCARQVQHLMTDTRSVAALDVIERFANGKATEKELDAARDAARDAALDAWDAAWGAAWAAWAARDAALDARAAARDAAWGAWAAARAARDAVRNDAWASQEKELRRVCAAIAKAKE